MVRVVSTSFRCPGDFSFWVGLNLLLKLGRERRLVGYRSGGAGVDEGAEIFESSGRERVWDGNDNLRHVVLCLFVCVFLLVFIEVEAFCLTVVVFVVTVAVWFFMLMMFILTLALALASSVVSILTLVVLVLVVSVVVLVAVAVAVAVVAVAVVLALVSWVLAAFIPGVAIRSVEMTINLVVVVVSVSSAVSLIIASSAIVSLTVVSLAIVSLAVVVSSALASILLVFERLIVVHEFVDIGDAGLSVGFDEGLFPGGNAFLDG